MTITKDHLQTALIAVAMGIFVFIVQYAWLGREQVAHFSLLDAKLELVLGEISGIKIDISEVKDDISEVKVDITELKDGQTELMISSNSQMNQIEGIKTELVEIRGRLTKLEEIETETNGRISDLTDLIPQVKKLDEKVSEVREDNLLLQGTVNTILSQNR